MKLPVFERPKSDPTPIGFQGYVVNTEEPILGFHHIVIAYCVLAFVLLYPFVTCGRYYRANVMAKKDNCEEKHEGVITSPPGSDLMPGDATAAAAAHANANAQSTVIQSTSNMKDVRGAESSVRPQERADVDVDQQQEEDPATPTSSSKSSVEEDPEKPISEAASTPPAERSTRDRANASASAGTNTKMQRPFGSQVASSTGLSRIPSAATTGLLYARSSRSSGAWPRQKHSRRPTGVPSWQWKRAIQTERRHHMRQLSHQSGTTNSAWRLKKSGAVGAMSDLANSVLDAEMTCPKETTISQNHKMMDSYSGGAETALYSHTALARRQRQRRESFNGSTRSGSVRSDYYRYPPSVMSSIVDDITPVRFNDCSYYLICIVALSTL